MSEIKSTLDLVMERTRNLVQTEEEKFEIRAREREARIKGYVLGLREGRIEPGDLPGLAADEALEDFEGFRGALIRGLLGALDLELDNGVLVEALRLLGGERLEKTLLEVEAIFEEYRRAKAETVSEAADGILEELAATGISGSALRPIVEADPGYLAAVEELRRRYQGKLERMLEKIG